MKRLIAMLLAAVMVCAMFAGCSDDENTPNVDNGGRPEAVDPGNFKNTDIYPLEGEHSLSMGIALENA